MREPPDSPSVNASDVRTRIVKSAAELIAAGGPDAATTRAVAAAAGVQAPTIYRLFGDKRGLLDAVAEQGFAAYLASKTERAPHPDPVQDLRDGWDMHVAFGLAHPGLFAIIASDLRPAVRSPAMAAGYMVLQRRIRNIGGAGRLKVSEERAIALLQSMAIGTVLTLLTQPQERRDPKLSEAAREAVVAAITGEAIAPTNTGPRLAANALSSSLDQVSVLTKGERHLLEELLNRIAEAS